MDFAILLRKKNLHFLVLFHQIFFTIELWGHPDDAMGFFFTSGMGPNMVGSWGQITPVVGVKKPPVTHWVFPKIRVFPPKWNKVNGPMTSRHLQKPILYVSQWWIPTLSDQQKISLKPMENRNFLVSSTS